MDKIGLTEDRICTVLKEKLYSMAYCESQMEYEPLQLKWMLPLEGTQGMITIFKNVIFLLGYVQKHGCSKDTVDQIIGNDIQPVVSWLSNEYDFFISTAIIIICSTVDDFSNERELMSLVHEIIGKFIYMLELAEKQSDSASNNTNEDGLVYEIDTNKLVIGMTVKNYKELCDLFGVRQRNCSQDGTWI